MYKKDRFRKPRLFIISGIFSIFEQVIQYNPVWGSLSLIKRETVY